MDRLIAASARIPTGFPSQTAVHALPGRRQISFLPVHVAVAGLALVACYAAIGFQFHEPAASHDILALATGLAGIGLIVYARYGLRLPWMSAGVVYLMLFWLFHYGMTFTGALVPDALARLPEEEIEWQNWPNARLAMILGLIGAVSFVFGIGFFAGPPVEEGAASRQAAHDSSLYRLGWLVMLGGTAGSGLLLLRNGGLDVFASGYHGVLSLIGDSLLLGTLIDLSQLGCLLALCGAGQGRWVAPLAVWTAFAGVPMLLLGLRTGVMIPLVSCAIILAHRGIRLRRDLVAAAIVVALVVIPAVRVFREDGFANRSETNWTELTPLDTLTELGGSLEATKAYVDWIEDGDPYLLGASYWAPIDRQVLARVLPGREQIPWDQDERVPMRLMESRDGSIGGSATGEAYYNFGLAGPFIFYTCVGLLFGWLERLARKGSYGCAILGSVMFIFFFNIRSDWLSVPARVAQSLALVGLAYLVSRFAARRVSPA